MVICSGKIFCLELGMKGAEGDLIPPTFNSRWTKVWPSLIGNTRCWEIPRMIWPLLRGVRINLSLMQEGSRGCSTHTPIFGHGVSLRTRCVFMSYVSWRVGIGMSSTAKGVGYVLNHS